MSITVAHIEFLKQLINDRIDEIIKVEDPPLVEEEFLYLLLHAIEGEEDAQNQANDTK